MSDEAKQTQEVHMTRHMAKRTAKTVFFRPFSKIKRIYGGTANKKRQNDT